jgi:hypothetical protein
LQVDDASARLQRHHQARDLEAGQRAAPSDNEHRRRDIGLDAGLFEQHASATGDDVAQFADPAAGQGIELREFLIHHAADDGQRRRLGHAVHDRPGQGARDSDDRGYLACFEVASLHAELAAADFATKLLFQDAFCG